MFAFTNANTSSSLNLSSDYISHPNATPSTAFMEDDSPKVDGFSSLNTSYNTSTNDRRMAHRRSHAEIASDSEPEDSCPLYLANDDDDDDDQPVHRRQTNNPPIKRTRLSSGADLTSGTLTPKDNHTTNQSLPSPPPSGGSLPPRPQRSRSLGDVNPFHRDSSPSSSPSCASSRAAANRKMGLSIVPPTSITRNRSFLPFSPRFTATQFLGVPTVQHSPRAALPVSDSPLENLFSQLTMQTSPINTPARQPTVKAFSHRVNDTNGDPNYPRRSLSISISPSPEVLSPGSASFSLSPVFTAGSVEPRDPPKSSWLVRVESAEDMLDDASTDRNAALPSILTGAQMSAFFAALRRSTDPEWLPLALAWKWQCETSGVIHRHEFVAGMQSMGCESLHQLDARVQSLRLEIESMHINEYKPFFVFVFHYLRQSQSGNRKTIGIEISRRLLHSMLRLRFPVFIEDFSEFLEHLQQTNPMMRLTADSWTALLDFANAMSESDYVSYAREESCAWPSLFDEYIQWIKTHKPVRVQLLVKHEKSLESYRSQQHARAAHSPQTVVCNSAAVRPFDILCDQRIVALDDDHAHMNGYEGDVENMSSSTST